MKVKNNAVFTGVIIGEPKLGETKFGKKYVMFNFQIIGVGEIVTIPCVCWHQDLAVYFANNASSNEYLIITGYLSEYTKQHQLQFILESFDYTEVPAHDMNGINHVHLFCPIVSKYIKACNNNEYAVLKLETNDDKYCFCISNSDKYIAEVKGLELETQLVYRTWANISGQLINTNKDKSSIAVNMNYLNTIPEYDREALLDAACDYDPIFD